MPAEIVSILAIENNKARVQLENGAIIDGSKIIMPFAFFANMPIDENSLGLLFKDGSLDNSYVMPVNIITQPIIASGDVAIKDFFNFNSDSNSLSINADVQIQGKLQASGECKFQNKPFLQHTHSGVQSGSSNTGAVS